jgi:hypothetical protein
MMSVAALKLISLLLAAGAGLLWSSLPFRQDYWDGSHLFQFMLGFIVFIAAWCMFP